MAWDISNILINLQKKIGLAENRASQVETGLTTLSKVVSDAGSYGDEVLVGKWGDTDLYRKVIDCGAMPNATTKATSLGLTNITLRMSYGFIVSSGAFINLPFILMSEGAVSSVDSFSVNLTSGNIITSSNRNASAYNAVVVLYYTKNPPTRDNDDIEPEERKSKK